MQVNLRKEKLSRAYVSALCSTTGCAIAEWDVDDDSVDLTLKKRDVSGRIRSPMIDIQLKASARAAIGDDGVSFPLKTKNFEDLRIPAHYPRILVVLALPSDVPSEWLDHTDESRLSLIACGYWASLAHLPVSSNATSTTVKLERTLTAHALDDLMQRVSEGRPLSDDA
jgi:hypothetical protein